MRRITRIMLLIAALLCSSSCDWTEYTLPLVVITHPVDGAYLTEPVTIKVEVTDTDTVEAVTLFIDEVEIGQDSLPPYEMYWEVTYWADGHNHSVTASATDEAGNIGLSNQVTVRVSTSARIGPPDIIAPAKNTIFAIDSPITFRWHSVRTADQYELEISATHRFSSITFDITVTDTSTIVTELEEGSYYWRVRGLDDYAGGTEWSEVRRFYLATDPSDVLVFTEYEANPVISTGDAYWSSRYNIDPFVIYEDGIYKMWFVGRGEDCFRIRYATSSDGINWDIRSEPVLEPLNVDGFDEIDLRLPFVMKMGDIYRMYFTSQHNNGICEVFLATSADGVTWERYSSEPVLGVGEAGEFDSGFTGGLHILYKDGTYYMWYTAGTALYNAEKRIGLAYSQDGISWEKYSGNPVLGRDPIAEDGLYLIGYVSSCILSDGRFEMFYTLAELESNVRSIYRAWSTDGINWSRDPFNPIIGPTNEGAWNPYGSSSASVLRNGDLYHIWFSGYRSISVYRWSIGYGTAQCAE